MLTDVDCVDLSFNQDGCTFATENIDRLANLYILDCKGLVFLEFLGESIRIAKR
jgi:hypothetical protein